MATKINK